MTVNAKTLELVKKHEGLRLEAYADVAHGWAVPTIGYGHTNYMKPPEVFRGMKITKEEAERILLQDLAKTWDLMRPHIRVNLNENQRGALISFTFNLGIGNFTKSTLLKKLNAGDFAGASNEFGKWVNANGKPYPGLIKRRAEEANLFNTKPAGTDNTVRPSDPTKTSRTTLLDVIINILMTLFRR